MSDTLDLGLGQTMEMQRMQIKAGEILIAENGQYYRVIEIEQDSVSLMRVGGQTVFSCRFDHVERNFRSSKASRTQTPKN